MAGVTEDYQRGELDKAIEQLKNNGDFLSECQLKQIEDVKKLLPRVGESSRKVKRYYLLNSLAEWQMLLERRRLYQPKVLWFARELKINLKNMIKKLKGGVPEGATNGSNPHENGTTIPSHYRWSTSEEVDRNMVHGFSEKENFMERFLTWRDRETNGSFKTIAILGVAGVGKTTLCQLTFNNERVIKDYSLRIWVCMSKEPGNIDDDYKKEVLKRMLLQCPGVDQDEAIGNHRTIRELLNDLCSKLEGRRYLIVLDNAFNNSDDFFHNLCSASTISEEKLAVGLPKECGGAVIVTTRSKELAKGMVGEENVHPLLPLKDEENCWKIFQDSAGENVKQLPEDQLKHLRGMTLSKCGGLPLATKMMGQIMEEQLAKLKYTPDPVTTEEGPQ